MAGKLSDKILIFSKALGILWRYQSYILSKNKRRLGFASTIYVLYTYFFLRAKSECRKDHLSDLE